MAKQDVSGARFCIVPQSALAVFRQRPADEAIAAQAKLEPAILDALEEMVSSARAGRLESDAALELRAIAW